MDRIPVVERSRGLDAAAEATRPERSTAFAAMLAQARPAVVGPAAKAPPPAAADKPPVLYVIDFFSRKKDYTPTFSLTHGDLVASQVKAETGLTPRSHDIEKPKLPKIHPGNLFEHVRIREGLKQGLQRVLDENPGRLDHVYVNISVARGIETPDLTRLMEQAQKRGAHIYVAAGNDRVNMHCTPHVWCIGSTDEFRPDGAPYPENRETDRRYSSNVFLTQVAPNKIDVNGDGRPDLTGNLGVVVQQIHGTSLAAPRALADDVNRRYGGGRADPNPTRRRD